MNRLMVLCAVCLSAVLTAPVRAETEAEFGTRIRAASADFVQSLDEEQSRACLQPNDKALRWKIQYTGGKREGVQIAALKPDQRTKLEVLFKSLLSEQGLAEALKVIDQKNTNGLGTYYVAYFGDPRKGDFALRIAEHHLTLIQLELASGEVTEFGPVLLGSDPPVLWKAEEQALLDLWTAMGDAAAGTLLPGRAVASEAMATTTGKVTAVKSLSPAARAALEKVWNGRMSFFSEPVRARIDRLIKAQGGLDAMRMAFYNEPALKRCEDGGRWDWKLAGDKVLLDFETSRKHTHMSLWIR